MKLGDPMICDCPDHPIPCHRKPKKARRQCSACIEYCYPEKEPVR